MSARFEFEQALLVDRVVNRAQRIAMEHDTPEALAKYLTEHPDADRSKHSVKKPEAKTEGKPESGVKETSPKKKAPKDSKAIAKASPHELRDKGHAAEKAGKFDKAFEQYTAAAEVFRSRGMHDAAKSMDSAAKAMAKSHAKKQKQKS